MREVLGQPCAQQRQQLGPPIVEEVRRQRDQLARLRVDRLKQRRMRMAERRYPVGGGQVEILASLVVPDPAAFATHHRVLTAARDEDAPELALCFGTGDERGTGRGGHRGRHRGHYFTRSGASWDARLVRLGILASEMQGERTGVGRYVEGLLTGLSRTDFDGEAHLFFQGARFEHALWSDPRFRLSFAGEGDRSAVWWEQLSLPRRLAGAGLDVFLGPAYSLPPRLPCPALVALHDLSFEVLPQEFGWRELWRRRLLARSAARRASRVLTLSRAVARQIEERYGVAAQRIDVLPLAVDDAVFAPTPRAEVIEAPSGERVDGPYVLYLGTILPRRRIDLLVEAFVPIARDRPDLQFVIAGANRLPQPELLHDWVERAGLLERVVDLGWVPERELPALLASAELTFYLSTYEGFGLPPMESLAAGTPTGRERRPRSRRRLARLSVSLRSPRRQARSNE